MNAQSPITGDLQMIALADLKISPMNARPTVPTAEVEAMADSIAINGLMQNLMGYEGLDGIEIVAGGKRLRALQLIASDPERSSIHVLDPVPVRITGDEGVAQEWAGAENEARSDPHPADQIRAYRDLAATGADAASIARVFAKTEAHVRGRLKLAQLPDTALKALETGKINLDEAKALTLANDPAQLDRVLEAVCNTNHYGVRFIRNELGEGKISATDRRAVYVGLDTYKAEGGAITDDLFEGQSLLHNEELLNTLFATKLSIDTERVQQDEGWNWAIAVKEHYLPYDRHDHLRMLHPTPGELSEADAEEYDKLLEQFEADAISPNDEERLEDLQRRLDGYFTDEDYEIGGVFVYVNSQGKLTVDRAYAQRDSSGDAGETTPGQEPTKEVKIKPPITAAGVEDLHTIAALALQTALVDKSETLLDLFAFQCESDMYAWAAPLNIQTNNQKIEPSETDGVLISARLTAETELSGSTPTEQFAAFRAQGKSHRNTVLARNLARTLNAPFHSSFGKDLMAELGVNIRKIWTPTATNFFSRCSVGMLQQIWVELLELEEDDPRIKEFAALRKGEKGKELEDLFNDASAQEAHGLSRAQVKVIDAWMPADFTLPEVN